MTIHIHAPTSKCTCHTRRTRPSRDDGHRQNMTITQIKISHADTCATHIHIKTAAAAIATALQVLLPSNRAHAISQNDVVIFGTHRSRCRSSTHSALTGRTVTSPISKTQQQRSAYVIAAASGNGNTHKRPRSTAIFHEASNGRRAIAIKIMFEFCIIIIIVRQYINHI